MSSDGNKVFVGSTCYDLVDVRAELYEMLREQGFSPMLSDISGSDFDVPGTINSIETNLVNVRVCDVFWLLVDRRYGPRLSGAMFGHISATHLEYEEAKRCNKRDQRPQKGRC